MPFPLAHPAAVLPFRRWCPGRLSFLVGSWTHILLDGLTHREGWCVHRFDMLREGLGFGLRVRASQQRPQREA